MCKLQPMGQIWPTTSYCKLSFIAAQPCPFVDILSVPTRMEERPYGLQSKILTTWNLERKSVDP